MSVTCIGKLWALTSFVASVACAVGYYFPYWLEGFYVTDNGELVPMYFGVFRRCAYPRLGADGRVEIVNECGIYSSFTDIPSLYWQISTVTVGAGTCLALLLSLTSLVCLCVRDIITVKVARTGGVLQLLAGLSVGAGVAIYPHGWDSTQVVQACGHRSSSYYPGDCSLYWAFYTTAAGAGLTILCSTVTCQAFKQKPYYQRTAYDV
ncbi:unnamed protein product [Candidula unifasciata]|uniref:Lipoma HMGIC fusion partner-like protein n=1 Tax=Candidula unifasciata TaxID=100452 RepID=A0A8S3ZVG1_9EUPU|nr:unnamed protein product [Candidula unifasciata]